jgi:hypothetical protein
MHSQGFHSSIADEALRVRECRRVSRIKGHRSRRAVCGVITSKASALSLQRRVKSARCESAPMVDTGRKMKDY